MAEKRTSLFENGLIWFGAAVSLAEILTGTYFAPLGFSMGVWAILLGHIIGCTLLFLAGVIGGRMRKSAMETVKFSFGQKGCLLFAALNVIQLVGWTAIMIYDGSLAANGIWGIGRPVWACIIGALIVVWIVIGIENLGKLNTVAMSALFLLTIFMSFVLFSRGGTAGASGEAMSFGAAVELSVAMPLSWLPLISDYTRSARQPVKAAGVSAITYGVISFWMYLIGMAAALFTGESDIARIILHSGVGMAGLVVIVLSTVTTTFLDAYSAGISSESISAKLKGKWVGIVTAIIGTVGAILFPMDDITGFLYFIGSVFAPMIAVQIANFFVVRRDCSGALFGARNIVVWLVGFLLYRFLMGVDLPVGNTLPDMVITFLLVLIVHKLVPERNR